MKKASEKETTTEYLFETAINMDAAARKRWLQEKCQDDPVKFREVNELVDSWEAANTHDFMSRPAWESVQSDDPLETLPGQTLGPYTIERVLGKGGMGTVFLAHRSDGQFEKQVAIKVVNTRQFDADLLTRERQILADLEIPHVVNLLDGGTTDDGYPYIVMQYVDGTRIDDYVFRNNLKQKQIVSLLAELAGIIHQANNRGIIHCDLKPGNILHSDTGLKLLDFGISRVLEQSRHMEFSTRVSKALTPEYSSPQRLRNHIPGISDDVFSLGIIMGVLLTRQQPVLMTNDNHGIQETNRAVFLEQIRDAELKAIFAKATCPHPEDRYPSAKALANDLTSWLNNESVSALSDHFFYRVRKGMIKFWPQLAVSLMALTMLISIPLLLYSQASYQKKANEANDVLTRMIEGIPKAFDDYYTSPQLRKMQVEYALSSIEGYDSAEIRTNLARLYTQMGEISGHPYAISLTNLEESKNYYQKATDLYRQLLNQRDDPVAAHEEYTSVKRHLAVITGYDGDIPMALEMMYDLRQTMKDVYEQHNVPDSKRYHLGLYAMVESYGHFHLGHYQKASTLLDEANHYFDQTLHKPGNNYLDHLAFYYEMRGHLAYAQNRLSEASGFYMKVIDDFADYPPRHWKIWLSRSRSQHSMGCLALKSGQLETAHQHFTQARHIYTNLEPKYSTVTSLMQRKQDFDSLDTPNIANSISALYSKMNCQDPRKYVIPPRPGK